MKTLSRNILIGLVSGGALLVAGTVTIPNTFTPNTTAKAAEVNANFNAVKSAVNDNASKISTNAGKISANENDIATNAHDIANNTTNITANANNITANTTALTGVITGVTAGNGLDGGGSSGNVTVKLQSTSVTIPGNAFQSESDVADECELRRGTSYSYFSNTSTKSDCNAYASVPVPNNARVTKVACLVLHYDSTTHTVIKMYQTYGGRLSSSSPYIPVTKTIATLTFNSRSNKVIGASSSIDAGEYDTLGKFDSDDAIVLEYAPSATDTADTDEKLYGCTVSYEF
jgi:hypothetical protein